MPSSNIERKLAAIMFTDIAGYTEQMSKDEDKAFALIKKKRDLLLPLLEKHEGKLIKEIGDGTLTRYFKADNAIDCASTFQSKTDTDLNVRAGIHTGEVIVDKEDVFGDVADGDKKMFNDYGQAYARQSLRKDFNPELTKSKIHNTKYAFRKVN